MLNSIYLKSVSLDSSFNHPDMDALFGCREDKETGAKKEKTLQGEDNM